MQSHPFSSCSYYGDRGGYLARKGLGAIIFTHILHCKVPHGVPQAHSQQCNRATTVWTAGSVPSATEDHAEFAKFNQIQHHQDFF